MVSLLLVSCGEKASTDPGLEERLEEARAELGDLEAAMRGVFPDWDQYPSRLEKETAGTLESLYRIRDTNERKLTDAEISTISQLEKILETASSFRKRVAELESEILQIESAVRWNHGSQGTEQNAAGQPTTRLESK